MKSTQNDVTGDDIKSKSTSDRYRDNWDRIFKKGKDIKGRYVPGKAEIPKAYPGYNEEDDEYL